MTERKCICNISRTRITVVHTRRGEVFTFKYVAAPISVLTSRFLKFLASEPNLY